MDTAPGRECSRDIAIQGGVEGDGRVQVPRTSCRPQTSWPSSPACFPNRPCPSAPCTAKHRQCSNAAKLCFPRHAGPTTNFPQVGATARKGWTGLANKLVPVLEILVICLELGHLFLESCVGILRRCLSFGLLLRLSLPSSLLPSLFRSRCLLSGLVREAANAERSAR